MIIFLTIIGIFCILVSITSFSVGIYLNLKDEDAKNPVDRGMIFFFTGLVALVIFFGLSSAPGKVEIPYFIFLFFSIIAVFFFAVGVLYLIITALIAFGVIKEGKNKKRTFWGSYGRFMGLISLGAFFHYLPILYLYFLPTLIK